MTDDPKRRPHPLSGLGILMKDYLSNRMMRERSLKHEDADKRKLMDLLADFGEVSYEGGHHTLPLPEPLPYLTDKGEKVKVTNIKRTRRVSQIMDHDRAAELCERLGLTEECTVTTTSLSEELILAANFRGDISDGDLKALYDEKVTYAFDLIKEKDDD